MMETDAIDVVYKEKRVVVAPMENSNMELYDKNIGGKKYKH